MKFESVDVINNLLASIKCILKNRLSTHLEQRHTDVESGVTDGDQKDRRKVDGKQNKRRVSSEGVANLKKEIP